MKNLIIDFDLTFLWPSIAFALIVLWISIRTYLRPRTEREYCRPSENRGYDFADNDAERKVNDARWHLRDAEWELGEFEREWRRNEEKRQAKGVAWVSAITLLMFIAVLLISDRLKANVEDLVWSGLQCASFLTFIIAILTAWHYARKLDRIRLGFCLLAMLLAAASTEHFIHQTINVRHAICPHCTDDDDQTEDQ